MSTSWIRTCTACRLTAMLLVASLVPLVAPAQAVGVACIGPPSNPYAETTGLIPVTGVIEYLAFNTACSGLYSVQGFTPSCAGAGTLLGTYCGKIVPAGGNAYCTWSVGTGNAGPVFLFVGFDRNGDGNVLASSGEAPLMGPLIPGVTHTIPNLGSAGRVIAYPTAMSSAFLTNTAVNHVGCF